MTESPTPTSGDRRAQHVAAFGLVLQLVTYGTLLTVSIIAHSDAVAAASRFMLIGLPIWLILLLLFAQRRRVQAEALETAELKRARQKGVTDAIFALDEESFLLERNRLTWTVRWMLPATTVLLAVALLGGHFVGWGSPMNSLTNPEGFGRTQHPELMMWFVVGAGFLSFLYARYALALARLSEWQLLRAGATCMAGNALACLVLVIALMIGATIDWAEPLFVYGMRAVLVVLGLEFSANFILDFYRPRAGEKIPRPSFDSRLLGLISEPGGVARSIAEALNYQFGFEVSSTWFYQLLQRWMFPIMVFTFAVVLALTGIVIVDADEQVVVERFGRLVEAPATSLGPGLHAKLPFPIDVAYRAPVAKVNELVIGEATQVEKGHEHEPVLWTKAHKYLPELMLPVASPKLAGLEAQPGTPGTSSTEGESVPVSLLMVSVPIEYRIRNLQDYLYTYDDPVKLMECVAYRILSDFGASVDIDQLMGPGRRSFNEQFAGRIQKALDQYGAGIEIVFAGIRGAHPPAKNNVADAFQSVVSARTNMGATINAAEGEARRVLTTCAGTVDRAQELDGVIRERDRLQRQHIAVTDPSLVKAQKQIETLLLGDRDKDLEPLSGTAAGVISQARATSTEMVNQAASRARSFGTEVAAYQAAPELYRERKMLEVYEDLEDIRKYVVIGDSSNVIIIYRTTEEAGLDRVLSKGLEGKEK